MSEPTEGGICPAQSSNRPGQRIALLAGQAFALGLTAAWILVPSTAVFLDTFGSGLLPVTYIGAAFAGVGATGALAAAFRRRPLASVATTVLAGLSISLLACWILLWVGDARSVSFGLLVLVPLVVPVGFMFVVGQAGMLLDVRSLKVLYARVVAGFALGFVTGGSAGPLLLGALGRAEHLLVAAAAAAGAFFVLVRVTRRLFPIELSVTGQADAGATRPTVRLLLRDRYVALIVGFQMLSAVESQWLDFLVFDRAAQRYDDSAELARFVSLFTAIAYGADLVFLLVAAGLLLRRFGLRYGLTANAGAVLVLVGAMVLAASLQGAGATTVFVLIVAARATDLVFSDGTSRTSLSAAYQAVPLPTRLVAQATVEGLAVPVAIGVSGLVLIVLRSTIGTDGLVLPVLTSFVITAWLVVAAVVYRGYRVKLLAGLRQRALDPADLSIDDANSLEVIDRLVASDDERDVRLGLDTLTTARHPALAARLRSLATDASASVRTDALDRLLELDVELAATLARAGLDDPNSTVRAACVRVLVAAGDPSALAAAMASWDDPSPTVKVASVAALSRLGDDGVRAAVATEMAGLARAADARDRVIFAEVLAASEPGRLDRGPLRSLLEDPDVDVVNAALGALRWPEDSDLFDHVVGRLHDRRTAGAAIEALAAGGDDVVRLVDGALGLSYDRRIHVLLARVCRMIGGALAMEVLRRGAEHPDREVGLAFLSALGALASPGIGPGGPLPGGRRGEQGDVAGSSVVRSDLQHATDVLCSLVALEDQPSAAMLRSALRDELDLVRRRVVAGLATQYGTDGLGKVALQLAQGDQRSQALAIEWLDVTLTGMDRAATALLEPELSDAERMGALVARFPIGAPSLQAILDDLVEDSDGRWRQPWLSACALHAGYGMPGIRLDVMIGDGDVPSGDGGVDDSADIFSETLVGLRLRQAAGRAG